MKKGFYLQSLLVFCFILFSVVAKATVPVITSNPRDTAVCKGDSAYFSIVANDTPGTLTMYYTWQVSTDGGTNWSTLIDVLSKYRGAATDTLWITTDISLNNNLYRVIDSNTDGLDTSLYGKLTVKHADAGTITGASAVCKAGTTTLSDAVTGGVWLSITKTIATVGSASGIVTGVAHGYDTIKYAVTNTCGPDTTWTIIRVDTVAIVKPITGPTTTCKGSYPINLYNTNVLGTWIWSASNGHASVSSGGVVYGLSGGLDTISYIFTNACNSVTSTMVVTVDTLLKHGVISGFDTVCAGSWIHLSESVTGGMWITGSGSIAMVDGLGNVTGVSQGIVPISYFLSNGCGPSIALDTVYVFQDAAPINGLDSVGIGNTRAFTDVTFGGWWMSHDTSIATIDTNTGIATGVATGTTVITYTVTNICGTSIATITLNVGPVPAVSGIYSAGGTDIGICVGGTIQLSDSTTGGVGQWSSTRDSIASVDNNGLVTGIQTDFSTKFDTINVGIDTIAYTFTNGFGTVRVTIPVIINQAPVIHLSGPSIVSTGGNYLFRGTPYYSWIRTPNNFYAPGTSASSVGVWSDSNSKMGTFVSVIDSSNIHITSFGSFIVLKTGRDNITYTVHNGCGTTHKSWSIFLPTDTTVSVNPVNNSINALKVYPNPI